MKLFKKFLSLLIVFAYFSTQIAFGSLPESNVWAERRRKTAGSGTLAAALSFGSSAETGALEAPLSSIRLADHARWAPRRSKTPGRLAQILDAIPLDAGVVRETYNAGTSAPPIVLIEDVHMNADAQARIARVLQGLLASKSISLVGVEGGFGPFDFRQFRAFPDKNVVQRLSSIFLQENRMSAPSFVGITSAETPPPFVGVDDKIHYAANVQAYLDTIASRASTEKTLDERRRILDDRKRTALGPDLLRLDGLRTSYARGAIGLGVYVAELGRFTRPASNENVPANLKLFLDASALETSLDFSRVESERRWAIEKLTARLAAADMRRLLSLSVAFKSGAVGFGDYYGELKAICAKSGVDLRKAPAFAAYIHYALWSDQINAERLFDELSVYENRVVENLAKTPQQKSLLAESDHLRLAAKLVNFELTPSEWKRYGEDSPLKGFESFYREADVRSGRMIDNLLRAASAVSNPARQHPTLALVVGGFHAPAITQALKARKISFIVVSPKIERVDARAGGAYLSVFAREKTPLDRLFAGEKLFVGPSAELVAATETADANSATTEMLALAASRTPLFKGSGATATRVLNDINSPVKTVVEKWLGVVSKVFITPLSWAKQNTRRPDDVVDDSALFAKDPGTLITPAFAPGAWGILYAPLTSFLSRFMSSQTAHDVTFVVAGVIEGGLAGLLAHAAGGNEFAAGFWLIINVVNHYLFGVYAWNFKEGRWDLKQWVTWKRYGGVPLPVSFSLPNPSEFFRANYVASTSLLGFLAVSSGYSLPMVLLFSILPHALSNFHKEKRTEELRRALIDEQKGQFTSKREMIRLIESMDADITDDKLSRLTKLVENINPLAALRRFNADGFDRYRLAVIMQPGSTETNEGTGFKMLNDTVGYELMNRVWQKRNAVQADVTKEIMKPFGPDSFRLINDSYKSFTLAFNLDAIESARRSNPDLRNRTLDDVLSDVCRQTSAQMIRYLTVEQRDLSNRHIVRAVKSAQNAGKLPKTLDTFVIYWGLSEEGARKNARPDDILVRDAETLAAVNILRARPRSGNDPRPLGGRFDLNDLIASANRFVSVSQRLERTGLFTPQAIPVGVNEAGEIETRPIQAPAKALLEAVRRKMREETIVILKEYAQRNVPSAAAIHNFDYAEAYAKLNDYFRLFGALDIIKPWVGEDERGPAETLAADVNAALNALRAMKRMIPADRTESFRRLKGGLLNVLSQDRRDPFLGSAFDFYGRPMLTDDPRSANDAAAGLFVDFLGFGPAIGLQLAEGMNEIHSAGARSNDEARATYDKIVLTIGNNVLTPFARSIRKMRELIDDRARRWPSDRAMNPVYQFGGDDMTGLMREQLIFKDNGASVDPAFLRDLFALVPKGMKIRLILGTTRPYAPRVDADLETAMMLEDVNELANDAKKTEEKLKKDGVDGQVVCYSDGDGARWKIIVKRENRNGADLLQIGAPELIRPAIDQRPSALVRLLIFLRLTLHQEHDLPPSERTLEKQLKRARFWAETKAEESMIVFGFAGALIELPLLPGLAIYLASMIGAPWAALIASVSLTLLYEAIRYRTLLVRALARAAFMAGLTDRAPPQAIVIKSPKQTGKRHPLARVAAHVLMSFFISFIALSELPPSFLKIAPQALQQIPWIALMAMQGGLSWALALLALWNTLGTSEWRLSIIDTWTQGESNVKTKAARNTKPGTAAFTVLLTIIYFTLAELVRPGPRPTVDDVLRKSVRSAGAIEFGTRLFIFSVVSNFISMAGPSLTPFTCVAYGVAASFVSIPALHLFGFVDRDPEDQWTLAPMFGPGSPSWPGKFLVVGRFVAQSIFFFGPLDAAILYAASSPELLSISLVVAASAWAFLSHRRHNTRLASIRTAFDVLRKAAAKGALNETDVRRAREALRTIRADLKNPGEASRVRPEDISSLFALRFSLSLDVTSPAFAQLANPLLDALADVLNSKSTSVLFISPSPYEEADDMQNNPVALADGLSVATHLVTVVGSALPMLATAALFYGLGWTTPALMTLLTTAGMTVALFVPVQRLLGAKVRASDMDRALNERELARRALDAMGTDRLEVDRSLQSLQRWNFMSREFTEHVREKKLETGDEARLLDDFYALLRQAATHEEFDSSLAAAAPDDLIARFADEAAPSAREERPDIIVWQALGATTVEAADDEMAPVRASLNNKTESAMRWGIVASRPVARALEEDPRLKQAIVDGRLHIIVLEDAPTLLSWREASIEALRPALPNAKSVVMNARYRVILPKDFHFSDAFAAGADLARYRIFVEINTALAVELERGKLNDRYLLRIVEAVETGA